MLLPVATWSKEWVCAFSLAGIAGSNPAGSMDVFLFRVLRVSRQRCLRRADHSPRGVYRVWWVLCVLSRSPVKGDHEPEWGSSLTIKKKIDVCVAVHH